MSFALFQFVFASLPVLKGFYGVRRAFTPFALLLLLAGMAPAHAQDGDTDGQAGVAAVQEGQRPSAEADRFAIHGQTTYVWQRKPAFNAAYSGENSHNTVEYAHDPRTQFLNWPPRAAGRTDRMRPHFPG